VFTAGLTSVPNDVVEAARVDRAGPWTMIGRIKLPYLIGPAMIAMLIMVINNFNDFAKIWAMTGGGPAYTTTTLVVYVYQLAFSSFNMGYSSAIGVVWLLLLVIFAVFYVRLLQRASR
jgi:ABC-type sugar transport system permease subunit